MSADRIAALRRAVAASPGDLSLRLLLAESLAEAGDRSAADEYRGLVEAGGLPGTEAVRAGEWAVSAGELDLAARCLRAARESGAVEGVADLERRVDELAGLGRVAVPVTGAADGAPSLEPDPDRVAFGDVGGLAEVKRVLHRRIVLPLSRPDLYARYGRSVGGGVLLYGPPGCGKTLLARALAGECGLPFLNVRIEDVLDPYMGVSERNLHGAFERARAEAPGVLFLDELDGLAYARRKQTGSHARALVDVLLQELDAIGADNRELLIVAATNAPWDLDEALLRPGRFDRRIFVPPPDPPARAEILQLTLRGVPHEPLDLRPLVDRTGLYSGADLRALVQHAVELVIEEALDSGTEPPLAARHLAAALSATHLTTLDWLQQARTYVEFGAAERYADVAAFLGSPEVRRRLR